MLTKGEKIAAYILLLGSIACSVWTISMQNDDLAARRAERERLWGNDN